MTRRSLLAVLVVVAGALLAGSAGARRAEGATARRVAAERALEQAVTDARWIRELRAQRQQVAPAELPTQDVIARLNATLAAVGLSARTMTGLAPEANVAMSPGGGGQGPSYRRQSLRLSLQGLTPQDLGSFLAAWRSEQPLWHVERIELAHGRDADRDANRYDVTTVLSAVYLAHQSLEGRP